MTTARYREASAREDGPDVADLVWRLRANERSALAEVYDRHHEALRLFAQRLLGDGAAEDLVHDVFLSLPQAIKGFEGRGTLRSFLFSITINKYKHHVRAAKRYQGLKERFSWLLPSEAPAPSEGAQRNELADVMRRALDQLPVDQRVAFVLCIVEEHSSPEAAKIVGISEATIRTRVMRAKQKLQVFLEREGAR